MTEHETDNPQETRDQQVPDREDSDSQGFYPRDRGQEGSDKDCSDQDAAGQRAEEALAAFERAGSPTTLDASLQALARTDPAWHSAAFARVHARLRRALDEAPEGLPSTGAASGPAPGASA